MLDAFEWQWQRLCVAAITVLSNERPLSNVRPKAASLQPAHEQPFCLWGQQTVRKAPLIGR